MKHHRVGLGSLILSALLILGSRPGAGQTNGGLPPAAAEAGCTIVCAPCPGLDPCPDLCRLECPPGVELCGPAVCVDGNVCCNASCGICTPPDGVCTQQICEPTCVQTQLCIRNFHWSPNECRCVPDAPGACASDADCRLFDDTCTGCDCRALSNDDPDPICNGPGVACFAEPCAFKVAQCVAGHCEANPACPALNCSSGFRWSFSACGCFPARRPHAPHRPHQPHSPVPR